MNKTNITEAGNAGTRIAILRIVFLVSGFCGLIYESIWSHYLKLFVGHAAYAQTVVLVVFIGGMALGAWLIGHFAVRIRHPLRVYAGVEAAVGLISLVFHGLFVKLTEWGYVALLPAACSPESPCLAQWVLAALMILPQSVLLGTTFPLMTAGILRLAPRNPGSSIAMFYFLNSLGAVGGVLASAFVLIPAFGLPGALFTAGLLNIGVALAAYGCSKGAALAVTSTLPSGLAAETSTFRALLLVVAALTGLSSFVYEITWIRMLALVIGASTDAFELMLAAFILGLALGGLWVRKRIDRFADLIVALAVIQVLMGVAAVATFPVYDRTFDLLTWLLESLNRSPNGYLLYNLASHGIALLVMLPATFLAGMTLPLITTALLRGRQGEAAIGYVYAANTLGAIVGVILAVHFALPLLGLKGALLLGAAIDIGLAVALFTYSRSRMPAWVAPLWTAIGVAALLLVGKLVEVPVERTASGVYRHGTARLPQSTEVLFHAVGKTANVDVLKAQGFVSIRTNGKSDAALSVDPAKISSDEYTMAFAAVLPLAYRPTTRHAAVIGFGSGMTTATLLESPVVERVDTIEIEPAMIEGARRFGPIVDRAFNDPRSRLVIDDAKSYFARSHLRYDIIISEPSNPWVSGVSSLFTVEFYQRVKRQLNDGGVFVQWIQAYEFSDALLGTILRAIDEEFRDYAIYAANDSDMIVIASNKLLGSVDPAFVQWTPMSGTLQRLAMANPDEVEFRRLAGPATVRALLETLAPGVNSDYFPLVDNGAPRERFLRSSASALLSLATAAVPVVQMLEPRAAPAIDRLATGPAFHERRDLAQSARASHAWLVEGPQAVAVGIKLPRDIALLRAALWDCAALPSTVTFPDLMLDVARLANPQLQPDQAAELWRALRNAPCAKRLRASDLAWIDLFEAVGRRDAGTMAHRGRALAAQAATPELRVYALMAAATGLVATGQAAAARAVLDQDLVRAAPESAQEPVAKVLRGYAMRGSLGVRNGGGVSAH